MGAAPDPRIVRLGKSLLTRADELAAAMADVIRRDVEFYSSNPRLVDTAELRHSCLANMTYVFDALAGLTDADVSVAVDTGVKRARAGVPLAMVMAAYRVGFRYMWEATLAHARQLEIPTEAFLDATSQIMIAQDAFTQAMAGAYRDELTHQILNREEERSALVEAILFGRITDTQNLWDAADILRLPASGPYVVVAAEVPGFGRTGLSTSPISSTPAISGRRGGCYRICRSGSSTCVVRPCTTSCSRCSAARRRHEWVSAHRSMS